MNKKIIIFVTAMVLVFAMVTGATFAYFTSLSKKVTNTFVSGGFATLTIEEPKGDGNAAVPTSGGTNQFTVIPGVNLEKDPQIDLTFATNKITDAYVFVKITYGAAWTYSDYVFSGKINTDTTAKLTTNIDKTNWKEHTKGDGYVVLVYVGTGSTNSVVSSNLVDKNILAYSYANEAGTAGKKTIQVAGSLTQTNCNWITSNTAKFNLDFSAYAIQSSGLTIAQAWTELSK